MSTVPVSTVSFMVLPVGMDIVGNASVIDNDVNLLGAEGDSHRVG